MAWIEHARQKQHKEVRGCFSGGGRAAFLGFHHSMLVTWMEHAPLGGFGKVVVLVYVVGDGLANAKAEQKTKREL